MKIKLHLKSPGAVSNAIEDIAFANKRFALDIIEKYIINGECVTIEFDIENSTATVIQV